jgi:hypothetical protein
LSFLRHTDVSASAAAVSIADAVWRLDVSSLRNEDGQVGEAFVGFGNVMNRVVFSSIVLVLPLCVLSAWVSVAPFPSPPSMVGATFGSLESQLGSVTGGLTDKFVVWEKSRVVAVWSLQASYEVNPIAKGSLTRNVKRCLWIDWAGVSVLCQRASSVRKE